MSKGNVLVSVNCDNKSIDIDYNDMEVVKNSDYLFSIKFELNLGFYSLYGLFEDYVLDTFKDSELLVLSSYSGGRKKDYFFKTSDINNIFLIGMAVSQYIAISNEAMK